MAVVAPGRAVPHHRAARAVLGPRRRALQRWRRRIPREAFFQLASVAGPGRGDGAGGTQALSRLEALAATASCRFPGALLRETLVRHLCGGRLPGLRPEHRGGGGAGHRPRALPRTGAERARRAGTTGRGGADARRADGPGGWLVHLFSGARLLAAVAERTGSDADRSMAASTLARGQRLWSRGTVFPRLGRWPASALPDELRARGLRGRGRACSSATRRWARSERVRTSGARTSGP